MEKRWQALRRAGQSIWYDNIERELVRGGGLARLIEEEGVAGVTSNPSIFEKAIGAGGVYDDALLEAARRGKGAVEIYEELATVDVREAADVLRGIFDETNGADGYVSLEVSPTLAGDTASSIAEGKRLFEAIGRPNVMIKIPATHEGLPAITALVAAGIPVNATLIFSLEQYAGVANAYIAGIERRIAAGEPVKSAASVASFFVSRIDTAVDRRLPNDSPLRGKAAVAHSRLAYRLHKEIFEGARWAKCAAAAAPRQRMLWASTSTKNPAYDDLLYVNELIGPGTVNTMPPATLAAFFDHGIVKPTLEAGVEEAERLVERLAEAGIDLGDVGEKLQSEGVGAFSRSFGLLVGGIEQRRVAAGSAASRKMRIFLGPLAGRLDEIGRRIESERIASRIHGGDATVWKEDEAVGKSIRNRLGWLRAPVEMAGKLGEIGAAVEEIRGAGFRRVLLLGMGGSSLCPEVLRSVFDVKEGFLDLEVLDSTSPDAVRAAARRHAEPGETLFVVASKSGGTTEVNAFYDTFAERAPGDRFLAITDPGTLLEEKARSEGFRRIFLNPPDIGGRFSALSLFGLVPAALIGIDLEKLLSRAVTMAASSKVDSPVWENLSVSLGAFLAAAALEGRDKATFLFPGPIAPLGVWIEQLIAESTGKEGKGIVPVVGERFREADRYGNDRVFIHYRLEGAEDANLDGRAAALERAGHPVATITLADTLDLGGEFFRWEMATAVAGALLGINPFDEPNVKESKDLTKELLDRFEKEGALPTGEVAAKGERFRLYADGALDLPDGAGAAEALRRHLARAGEGDYIALLAYLPRNDETTGRLRRVGALLGDGGKNAVTIGIGPRFLHSTGQLHKGGPNNGVFVQITGGDGEDLPIPGWPFGFGTLIEAQALGDFLALERHGRRVVRCHITGNVAGGLEAMERALGGGRNGMEGGRSRG